MSDRILCLNYVPDSEAFGWADAVLHPGLTLGELREIAHRLAWRSPLKISLPPGEQIPAQWLWLSHYWREELLFERYTIRVDPRCSRPKDSYIPIQEESHMHNSDAFNLPVQNHSIPIHVTSYLLIGGPADGEQHHIEGMPAYYYVAVPQPPCLHFVEPAVPTYTPAPQVRYRPEVLVCPTKEFVVYIAEDLSIEQAMERLLTTYHSFRTMIG